MAELESLAKTLLPIAGVGIPVLVLLILLLSPEKIEKWSSILWKLLSSSRLLFRSAHKKYVKHDLQSRVNLFRKKLVKEAPGIAADKLRIEYINEQTSRESFLADGLVVIRLKRDDPQDHNFVHGAFHYVSQVLLQKAKRYLSPSQRDAMDLYVCTKMIESEKPSVVGFFLDEYLHPKTTDGKSKISKYVDDFERIDQGGLFFSVFVQELHYLGDKVFGRRKDGVVHSEVNSLIEHLRPIAERTVGDESDLQYAGTYCKFAIVIVGKPSKLAISIDPYVNYIRQTLLPEEVETIYLLSRLENKAVLDEICERFESSYECVRTAKFRRPLRYTTGQKLALQYLAVLRRKGVRVIQTSVS